MALFLLGGCSLLHRGTEQDRLGRKLAVANGLYGHRAEPGRLDQAIQAYLDLLGEAPGDPRVLAALTRAFVARGYGYPQLDVNDFLVAREVGLQCLRLRPAFDAMVVNAGGRVEPSAVATLTVEDADCLVWTTLAWGRWLRQRGPAGQAIDLEVVQALGRRSTELAPLVDHGRAFEALGLVLSLPPAPLSPDLDGARAAYDAAGAAAAGRLTVQVDRAEYVDGALGDALGWRSALERVANSDLDPESPDLLENRQAKARAIESLEGGIVPMDPWRSTPIPGGVPSSGSAPESR